MRKRNKLYTANKWNRPLFAEGIDREHQNVFDGMFSSTLNTSSKPGIFGTSSGLNYQAPQLTKPNTSLSIDWNNPVKANQQTLNSQSLVNNFTTEASKNNPYFDYDTSTSQSTSGMSSGLRAGLGIAAAAGSAIGRSDKYKNGIYDTLDPMYHLAGGRESTIGNGLSSAGVSLFQAGAQSGNGYLMLAGAGAKVLGGLTNAAFGTKWNKENINKIESNTSNLRASAAGLTQVGSNDDFLDRASNVGSTLNFSKSDVGSNGWFSGDKVGKKYNKLQASQTSASNYLAHAMTVGARKADNALDEKVMANVSAFGGPLDGNSGAIDYGFMSDYLTAKNKAASVKDKMGTNIFGNIQSPQTMFALGGDMQANGSDFTDGLSHISAGGSHEANPYDGVQVGISAKNGQPNLVEEGETIFDDYVFSRRIKVDSQTKKKFHLGKKSDLTFADVSKKLEKESLERPNDAISQAGLTKQMHALAEQQERQKAEEQQKEAQEAFEQLPLEQQQEIMQQVAMQEQQDQQQEAQQTQAMQEQQAQGQQTQEEGQQQEPQQMVDEQMQAEQQGMQPQMEEQQVNACGGPLNRFDKGGELKKAIYKALGFYTDPQFEEWQKANKLDNIDWNTADKNTALWDALGNKGAVLKHAMDQGYNFGAYTPGSNIYNLAAFNDKLDAYTASKNQGNTEGNYAPDKNFYLGDYKTIKDLENSDKYKAYTKYLTDLASRAKGIKFASPDAEGKWKDYKDIQWGDNKLSEDDYNALQTLWHHTKGTSTKSKGDPVPLFTTDANGNFGIADNAADLIAKYRTDGKGGIFHMTPDEIARGKKATNYVVNEDGTINEIIGDVPKDLALDNTFSWQTEDNDELARYYRKAPAANGKTTTTPSPLGDKTYAPIHKSTWGRTAGLLGPVVGLGMQAMGIGKPNYKNIDAALEIANGAPAFAKAKYLGNYLQYNPMDIWQGQNRLNANSRATDRAILNNSSPTGTKMAGLLASGYNDQIASGNLFRQALEYNDAQRQKVAEFNRGTDQYNAEAFNTTSRTNAEIANSNRRFRAQMAMENAQAKMNADNAWNQGIYGNVSSLFKGLGEWGKENAQHNMIADMAADGLFGTMGDQYIAKDYLQPQKNRSAKGGKITKKKGKRGLTF